jgi:hypothetical protein
MPCVSRRKLVLELPHTRYYNQTPKKVMKTTMDPNIPTLYCVGKVDYERKWNLHWYTGMYYGHPAQLPAQLPALDPQSKFLRLDCLIGQLYSTGFQPALSPCQLCGPLLIAIPKTIISVLL